MQRLRFLRQRPSRPPATLGAPATLGGRVLPAALVVAVVLLLAVAVSSYGAATTVKDSAQRVTYAISTTLCGEPGTLTITTTFTSHFTGRQQGLHSSDMVVQKYVFAPDDPTAETFRGTSTSSLSYNTNGATTTATSVGNVHYRGSAGTKLRARERSHFTIDANGQLRVARDSVEEICP